MTEIIVLAERAAALVRQLEALGRPPASLIPDVPSPGHTTIAVRPPG